MTEKTEKKEKEKEEEEKKKLKRRKKKGVYNVEPAEEPVKGPMGEDIYRV